MFEGDDLPTRRQNWDTSIREISFSRIPIRRFQAPAGKLRNDIARRVACTSGEFFGGLKHVVINVESGSHTKGVIEP